MTISRFYAATVAVTALLLSALLALLLLLVRSHALVEEAEHRRFEAYKLADELRRSSDDLTHMARLYAYTGDKRFYQYFQEVLDIREGRRARPKEYDKIYWDLVLPEGQRPRTSGEAKSLEDRMIELGFSAAEFRKLDDAKERSDLLTQLEIKAFDALKDGGTNADNTEAAESSGRSRALDILFGEQYLLAKARIMQPIGEFQKILEDRTAQEHRDARLEATWFIAAAVAVTGIILLLAALLAFYANRRIVRRLTALAENARAVSAGNYDTPALPMTNDEIGAVVGAFSQATDSARSALAELTHANAQLQEQQVSLRREKERSEELLHNILPHVIAERIKAGETEIADEFPEVSVMFADIAGFTGLAERLGPHKIVRLLNEIFDVFDRHLEEFNLEKIKTMGDCYMVVAGLPEPVANHAQNLAEFALKVRSKINSSEFHPEFDLNVRIGIHSGTAVAGVIGSKKIAYDLWGDVVNVASRMEATGEPGAIHVSEPFMIRLRDMYEFEFNGDVDVKGKGRMPTYFLKGRKFS